MRKSFFATSFLAAALVAVVALNPAPCNAQEAKTATELPAALTDKPRTAVDAVDEQTAAQKEAAAAQKKATEDNTAALKAAIDAAKNKKESPTTDYTLYYIGGALLIALLVWGIARRRRTGPLFSLVIGVLFLGLLAPVINAAPCVVPAGQPFVVKTLSVVADPGNPDAPLRRMVMPGQTRKLAIGGCGFGFNEHNVTVGFTGGVPVSVIPPVKNDEIVITVSPDASFAAPQYLNLALRINGSLVHTQWALEVQPPQAYAALQAAERHGVGSPSNPAPTIDRTARTAAVAAANNATTALDTSRTAANAAVTLGTKFEQLFGADGKSGVVGTEVVALRKDVNDLKAFAKSADAELFYQDGSSRMDDLSERLEILEKRGGGGFGVSKADFDQLRAEVAGLRGQVASYGNVTVGTIHRGTIAEKAAGKQKKAKAGSHDAHGQPVRNPVR